MAATLVSKCACPLVLINKLLCVPQWRARCGYHEKIKVDEKGKIVDAKFKSFGCGSAIASSSLATEWVKGKSVDEAVKIKNIEIAKELSLPPVKLHYSMLAEDVIKAALADYHLKQEGEEGGKTVTANV